MTTAVTTVAKHPSTSLHRSFLAFDFGTKTTGVASGNTLTGHATPLGSLALQGTARLDAIGKLIQEWQPDALVVGLPLHPDGAAHANTRRVRVFVAELHARFGLPVHLSDERYTTTAARESGARDLDAAAAALILEQHLRSLA